MRTIRIQVLGFRNMQEKLENMSGLTAMSVVWTANESTTYVCKFAGID